MVAKISDTELAVLKSAFENKESQEDGERCAYTQTEYSYSNFDKGSKKTTVARFDPVLRPESPWEVVSVNDQTPTPEESMNFQSDSGHPVVNLMGGEFNKPAFEEIFEEVKIISKEDGIWTFETPMPAMPEPPDENLKGMAKKFKMKMHIEIHEPTATFRAIKVSLIKPFRIWVVVRISKVEFTVTFGSDPNVKGTVMKEMKMEMNGRAAWKKMIQEQRTTFSDFDCSDRSSDSSNQIQMTELNELPL